MKAPRTLKRSAPQSLQVTGGRGVWQVRREDSQRATSRHASQAEAVAAARKQLRISGGQLSIHGADGRIRSTYTLGRKAMAKLNAVEGISLPRRLRKAVSEIDDSGQSPQQRRARIRTLVTTGMPTKR